MPTTTDLMEHVEHLTRRKFPEEMHSALSLVVQSISTSGPVQLVSVHTYRSVGLHYLNVVILDPHRLKRGASPLKIHCQEQTGLITSHSEASYQLPGLTFLTVIRILQGEARL